MKNKMKKLRLFALISMAALISAFGVVSCADVNGLHDQNAVIVTIEFKNFGSLTGDFAVAGDFNGDEAWEVEASVANITMKNGEGTASKTFPVTSTWIKFSLCELDSNWSRKWYPAIEGNSVDTGTAGNPQQNFYIGNLDLSSGTMTIVIDGSKSGTDAMVFVK